MTKFLKSCVVLLLITILASSCTARRSLELRVREVRGIEISLVDHEGKPVSGEQYRVVLPDGKVKEGRLDENGLARLEGIDPGECKITFPDLDKDAWERK